MCCMPEFSLYLTILSASLRFWKSQHATLQLRVTSESPCPLKLQGLPETYSQIQPQTGN